MASKQKTVVVGAGPVGALAAIYAAQRGHEVEVYEFRNDLRDPSTPLLNFTRSINLALSERGINAMRHADRPALLESVMAETLPMRGRMLHRRNKAGELYEEAQDYDIHGQTIFAVDRGGLNKRLLDELESMPNLTLFFNHKLTGANFKTKKAWFQKQQQESSSTNPTPEEIEITFDFLIGADGAHSSVRYHLMKYVRMDYTQKYIDTLWCEFLIPPRTDTTPNTATTGPSSKFLLSPHHLHIWPSPQEGFMFIAIPSLDGSFTCTLFLPSSIYTHLSTNPSTLLPQFFNTQFPGVSDLIPPSSLIAQFTTNPHLPLISIKCTPYHSTSSAVILGDAAHAMVPFYGQGMNAGLEDVRVLFHILDRYPATEPGRAAALEQYTTTRHPDALAIARMALQNYAEMSTHVTSPIYKYRKRLEEWLSVHVPSLGWKTRYSRVSFGNEPYDVVLKKGERQGAVLGRWLAGLGLGMGGVVIWALVRLVRMRRMNGGQGTPVSLRWILEMRGLVGSLGLLGRGN